MFEFNGRNTKDLISKRARRLNRYFLEDIQAIKKFTKSNWNKATLRYCETVLYWHLSFRSTAVMKHLTRAT